MADVRRRRLPYLVSRYFFSTLPSHLSRAAAGAAVRCSTGAHQAGQDGELSALVLGKPGMLSWRPCSHGPGVTCCRSPTTELGAVERSARGVSRARHLCWPRNLSAKGASSVRRSQHLQGEMRPVALRDVIVISPASACPLELSRQQRPVGTRVVCVAAGDPLPSLRTRR